jgi:hypothetical protein
MAQDDKEPDFKALARQLHGPAMQVYGRAIQGGLGSAKGLAEVVDLVFAHGVETAQRLKQPASDKEMVEAVLYDWYSEDRDRRALDDVGHAALVKTIQALIRRSHADDTLFNMAEHLQRQREWSGRTFGPGPRTKGVIDHIRKELNEIEAAPSDVSEWIDVVILALDGAWRAGFQPQQIIDALVAKQTKNEARDWPDWRTSSPDQAIEHVHPLPLPPAPGSKG